ncbi:hypothetical protein [Roseobacter sp. A03A-229]
MKSLPNPEKWWVYMVEGEPTAVHSDDIIVFMGAFEEAEMIDALPDYLEPAADTAPLEIFETDVSDNEEEGVGDVDPAESRRIFFKTPAESSKGRTEVMVDPEDVSLDDFDINNAMSHMSRGVITTVSFMVPRPPQTHYEVLVQAMPRGVRDTLFIKFDFTAAGYRMIYDASPSPNLTAQRTEPAVSNMMIGDAAGIFATTAFDAGPYESGRNTCHTFAAQFFKDLTGKEAEPLDTSILNDTFGLDVEKGL